MNVCQRAARNLAERDRGFAGAAIQLVSLFDVTWSSPVRSGHSGSLNRPSRNVANVRVVDNRPGRIHQHVPEQILWPRLTASTEEFPGGGGCVSPAGRRLVVVSSRFVASGFQLLLVLLLTRTAPSSTVESCLVVISSIQILSAVAAWGHPVVVLREVSAASEQGLLHRLGPHLSRVAIVSVVILAAGFVIDLPALSRAETVLVCACAGAQALTRIWSQALKAVRKESLALLLEFSLVPAVSCVAVSAFAVRGNFLGPTAFAGVQLVATAVAAGICALVWSRHRRVFAGEKSAEPVHGLHALGVVYLLAVALGHLPIVVATGLLDPLDVAAFAVAFRVAGLASTILNALTGYYGPLYARTMARKDHHELRRLLRQSQISGAALALPLLLVIPVGPWAFSAFGDEYSIVAAPYAVLAVGQYVNAATGVVAFVVTLSGSERALLGQRLAIALVLPLGWGLMIAAGSTSATLFAGVYSLFLIATNAGSLVLARRRIDAMAAASKDTRSPWP